MKRGTLGLAIGVGLVISITAPPAVGAALATSRSDGYEEIWCHTPEGDRLWKRVDLSALDQGQATSLGHFNANNPYGESCQIGPFV